MALVESCRLPARGRTGRYRCNPAYGKRSRALVGDNATAATRKGTGSGSNHFRLAHLRFAPMMTARAAEGRARRHRWRRRQSRHGTSGGQRRKAASLTRATPGGCIAGAGAEGARRAACTRPWLWRRPARAALRRARLRRRGDRRCGRRPRLRSPRGGLAASNLARLSQRG
jgi:hypothetical protein